MADTPVSQPFVAPGTRLSGDRETALAILPEARKLLSVVKLFCQTAGVPTFKASRRLPGGSWIEALIAGGQEYVTVFGGGGLAQRVRTTIRKWQAFWVNAQFPPHPDTYGYWGHISADGNTVCRHRTNENYVRLVEVWSRESGAWVDTQLPAIYLYPTYHIYSTQLSANGKELTIHIYGESGYFYSFHPIGAVWSRESGEWIDTHSPNHPDPQIRHSDDSQEFIQEHSGDGKTFALVHLKTDSGSTRANYFQVWSRESGEWVDTRFPWVGFSVIYSWLPELTLSTDGKVMSVLWRHVTPWYGEVWSRESGEWVDTQFPPLGVGVGGVVDRVVDGIVLGPEVMFTLSSDGKNVLLLEGTNNISIEVWSRESGKWVDTQFPHIPPPSVFPDLYIYTFHQKFSGDGKTVLYVRNVPNRVDSMLDIEVWTRESGAWGNTNFPLRAVEYETNTNTITNTTLSTDGKVVTLQTGNYFGDLGTEVWSRESGEWVDTQFPEAWPDDDTAIHSWSSDNKSVLRMRRKDGRRYPAAEVWTLREVETETDG